MRLIDPLIGGYMLPRMKGDCSFSEFCMRMNTLRKICTVTYSVLYAP